jgi:hypothetical protein
MNLKDKNMQELKVIIGLILESLNGTKGRERHFLLGLYNKAINTYNEKLIQV